MLLDSTAERIDALADQLDAPDEWRQAMHRAPRHRFVPDLALAAPDDRPPYLIDRTADPAGWWEAVYSTAPLVTQLDDGATDITAGSGDYTCSCSSPVVVLDFLELLALRDQHRVLEIGTGTGWTAGLLSHRVGPENVTTIELDQALAEQAAANLDEAGLRPELITGDGAAGWPDGAPYDRIHVACAVRSIPYAWIEQVRPGGIIVLPWSPGISHGHQVRLDTQRDGTALGRIAGGADYMLLRAQRPARGPFLGDPDESLTAVDPRSVLWDSDGAALALAALLPGVTASQEEPDEDGEFRVGLAHPDGSWATVRYAPGASQFQVHQHGPRRLWEQAEDAYFRWQAWGRPGPDRYGMTITPDGQHLWVDTPVNVLA